MTTTVELSDREKEVVGHIISGKTYQEIASEMDLSFETVKTYMARIRKKLKVTSKVQIAVWALENGLVQNVGNDASQ